MSHLYKALGKQLKELRKAAGLTQFKLAELAEVHEDFIGRLERGTSGVSLQMLDQIAAALGVPLTRLVDIKRDGSGKPVEESDQQLRRIILNLRTKSSQELRLIADIIERVDRLSKVKTR